MRLGPLALFLALLAFTDSVVAVRAEEVAPDKPHLLDCTVKDTVHLTEDGTLVKDPPVVPGTRALGRISEFVIDLATAVVRLPGLGDIAWIPAKGGPDTPELILTPVAALASATSISIHINRAPNNTWFLFFETDRVMSGTCVLLPVQP